MVDLNFTNALIIGAHGGIGAALARRLTAHNVPVTALSRHDDGFDVTREDTIERAAGALADQRFDLIVNAIGILEAGGAGPEKSFSAIDPADMAAIFAVNTIGPALVLKHFTALLADDRRAVFASLSARVGSIGDNRLGGWMSYRASKAALNQIVRCASVETARTHEHAAVIALHPGTIETDLTRKFARGRYTASPDDGADQMLATVNQLNHAQTGRFYAYDSTEIDW